MATQMPSGFLWGKKRNGTFFFFSLVEFKGKKGGTVPQNKVQKRGAATSPLAKPGQVDCTCTSLPPPKKRKPSSRKAVLLRGTSLFWRPPFLASMLIREGIFTALLYEFIRCLQQAMALSKNQKLQLADATSRFWVKLEFQDRLHVRKHTFAPLHCSQLQHMSPEIGWPRSKWKPVFEGGKNKVVLVGFP